MDRYLKEVGDRIRQARLKKGINQAQLAEIIDKTPPYVSNIEMGKQNMSIIVLFKIVKALDVSADWILAHDTPETVAITLDSVTKELEDCTPEERQAIIQMIQSLKGAMREGDYGLFVTLSNYTKNAQKYLDSTPIIRGINGTELVDLILKYYEDLSEKYRKMIPLKMVYIPVPKEEL